jgi:hypothetical protein
VPETVAGFQKESDLYLPISKVLGLDWAKELRFRNHLVEITATQGRRDTGGMWTRPDLTVVAVSTYAYVLGTFFDVITFEVKPAGMWHDVKGVFETAAHSRFATRSYLLIHVPEGEGTIPEADLERLQSECTRFQIGLCLFQDPSAYDSWHFLLDPVRREPNPEDIDQFIDQQMSDENKKKIGQWKT